MRVISRSPIAVAIAVAALPLQALHAQQVSTLESILVVGEKKERLLKDTVSSVAVLNDSALQASGVQSITDAVGTIANVVSLSGAVPDIRGVSGNGSAGGFNSITGGAKGRVSMLIDGVAEPFVADMTGDTGLWDIEQIEVYRGPQSTNNGRNSIAGGIYVKTYDPSFEWEGDVRLGYRNQEKSVDKAAVISGPLMEDVLAFRLSLQHVDTETLTNDPGFIDNPPDYKLNELETRRARGKILWKPTDDTDLLFTYSMNNEQGDAGRIYYTADDPYAYKRTFYRDIETDSDTASVKINHRFSENWSLEILMATMDYQWGFKSYEESAASRQVLVFDEDNQTLDAKLSFGAAEDAFHGHVGLAYFSRDQDFISTGSSEYVGDDSSDALAAYGEVVYALSDKVEFTAGLRVQREEQERFFDYITYTRGGELDDSQTVTLPKLVLQYHATDSTTLFISARQGYNAAGGAFSFGNSTYYYYDEEEVNTFEAGARYDSASGKLQLNANLFFNDYDGYQALNSSRMISNMDSVETYGIEVEMRALLSNSLELSAGFGLLETDIKDAGDAYASATGNELNSAPAVTANLSLTWKPLDPLTLSASVRHVDEYYGDINNTSERVAGGYTLTNLNARYDLDSWTLAAYVNNATDEEEALSREPAGRSAPLGYVAIVMPRTAGVSLTYHF